MFSLKNLARKGLTELQARIGIHIQYSIWDVITHPCGHLNDNVVKPPLMVAWINKHNMMFNMDVITCPCPNHDIGLLYLC